jgi:hypothetical protein
MTEIMDYKWDSDSTLSSTIHAPVQMVVMLTADWHYKEDIISIWAYFWETYAHVNKF